MKTKVHLMNSAMMPAEGTYTLRRISVEEFEELVVLADRAGTLVSSIGYPQNQALIREMTGVQVSLSRKETVLNDGDEMLIMRLKYRANAPKGAEVNAEDFEYFKAVYQKDF